MNTREHRKRPEIGVYLHEAAPVVELVKKYMLDGFDLVSPEQALPEPDRVTVYISNHGPMFAPLPAPALTVDYLLKQGKFDNLVAVTLFHRIIRFLPGMSTMMTRYFGHSTPALNSISGLVDQMKARRFHIIGTAPEGTSCMLSYDEPVGPFTKFGLLKAALEANANIVLVAQRGIEPLGRRVRFPWGLTLPVFGQANGIQVPVIDPRLKVHVKVRHERYQPIMPADDRAKLPISDQRTLVGKEFTRMRRRMLEMYESLS